MLCVDIQCTKAERLLGGGGGHARDGTDPVAHIFVRRILGVKYGEVLGVHYAHVLRSALLKPVAAQDQPLLVSLLLSIVDIFAVQFPEQRAVLALFVVNDHVLSILRNDISHPAATFDHHRQRLLPNAVLHQLQRDGAAPEHNVDNGRPELG